MLLVADGTHTHPRPLARLRPRTRSLPPSLFIAFPHMNLAADGVSVYAGEGEGGRPERTDGRARRASEQVKKKGEKKNGEWD